MPHEASGIPTTGERFQKTAGGRPDRGLGHLAGRVTTILLPAYNPSILSCRPPSKVLWAQEPLDRDG